MASPVQILIVEDDEIISNLIGVILEKKGYTVAGKVTTGEDAIMEGCRISAGSCPHGHQSCQARWMALPQRNIFTLSFASR